MRRKKTALGTLLVVLLALFLEVVFQVLTPESTAQPQEESATLVRVVDGDTIVVMTSTGEETVRFIGIDTPETVHPTKGVECYGLEASEALKEHLKQSEVLTLIPDNTQEDRDKYERILRYVAWGDEDVGLWLIQNGFAREYTYDAEYLRYDAYLSAQQEAYQEGLGRWSACKSEI